MMTTGGALQTRQSYFPYGEKRVADGSALPTGMDYTFTGQKSDDSTGLMFYGARYYDATLGRFTQADTIVSGGSSSQSLNRYAYVSNNPVRYTDPTGHMCVDGDENCGGGGGGGGTGGGTAGGTGGGTTGGAGNPPAGTGGNQYPNGKACWPHCNENGTDGSAQAPDEDPNVAIGVATCPPWKVELCGGGETTNEPVSPGCTASMGGSLEGGGETIGAEGGGSVCAGAEGGMQAGGGYMGVGGEGGDTPTVPPNPSGQPGNSDHQSTVSSLLDFLKGIFGEEGYEFKQSTSIKGSLGGIDRRPDVSVYSTDTGELVHVGEAARLNASEETFVARERAKMVQYDQYDLDYTFFAVGPH